MDITEHADLGSSRVAAFAHSVFPKEVTFQDAVEPLLANLSKTEMPRAPREADELPQRGTTSRTTAGSRPSGCSARCRASSRTRARTSTACGRALQPLVGPELHHRHGAGQDQRHRRHRRAPGLDQPVAAVGARGARRRRRRQRHRHHPRGLPRAAELRRRGPRPGREHHRVPLVQRRGGRLLGSQAIFSSYEKTSRDVKAMLQQDMTGFVPAHPCRPARSRASASSSDFVRREPDRVHQEGDPRGTHARPLSCLGPAGSPFVSFALPKLLTLPSSTAQSPSSRPSAATPARTTRPPPSRLSVRICHRVGLRVLGQPHPQAPTIPSPTCPSTTC